MICRYVSTLCRAVRCRKLMPADTVAPAFKVQYLEGHFSYVGSYCKTTINANFANRILRYKREHTRLCYFILSCLQFHWLVFQMVKLSNVGHILSLVPHRHGSNTFFRGQ